MRAKGKSIMSGSQKRLKRKGSIARGVSGPPSWNRTTPTRRVGLAIPRGSLKKEDVTQNLYAASMWSLWRTSYFWSAVDLYFVPNIDGHQVFAHFQRSRISLPGVRYQVSGIKRNDMRIDCQLRLHSAKNRSRLVRCGVMIDDSLLLFRSVDIVSGAISLRIQYLVNQYIRSLSELDQILGIPGISGKHYGVPGIVDAVAQGWLDRRVIDGEGRHLQITVLVNDSLLDIFSRDHYALRGKLFINVATDVDIELVGLLQMRHHLRCSRRPPDTPRCATAKNPAGQIEIRNSDNVVGMQVSQKHSGHFGKRDFELIEPLCCPTAAVKQELFLSRFDQNARSKSLHDGTRGARAQQSD